MADYPASQAEDKRDGAGAPPAPRGRTRYRKCLFCGAPFASAGAHERVCGPCKDSDEWSVGAAVTKGYTAW